MPNEPVTTDHMRAVCKVLGLPPECVRTVTVDAHEGVTATVFLRDRSGHIVARGDNTLTATVRLPRDS